MTSNSDIIDQFTTRFIQTQFPKYKNPEGCSKDIQLALRGYSGLVVCKRECVVDGDLFYLINLEGTIPIVYKGSQYNIPVRIMMLEDYPGDAPLVYLQPTSEMRISSNINYLNNRGKVCTEYLENWRNQRHPDLYKVILKLCDLFGENPPVWTKKTNEIVQAYESRTKYLDFTSTNDMIQESGLPPSDYYGHASRRYKVDDKNSVPKQETRAKSYHEGSPAKKSENYIRSVSETDKDTPGFLPLTPYAETPGNFHPSPDFYLGANKYGQIRGGFQGVEERNPSPVLSVLHERQDDEGGSAASANHLAKRSTKHKVQNEKLSQPVGGIQTQGITLASKSDIKILKNYSCSELIGAGGFAKVYLYQNNKTKHKVACKIVDLGVNDAGVKKCADALKREVNLLSSLDHPFIVKYISFEEEDNKLAMVMKYFCKGSLYTVMQDLPEGCFNEQRTRVYTWQILQGLIYLHDNGIIHKDIKARNILLDDQDIVRIADFGISKKLEKLVTQTTGGQSGNIGGTIYWQSPESLNDGRCGRKTDVWSLGCTVVEMLYGKPPLADLSHAPAFGKIIACKVDPPKNCSDIAKDFLQRCFRPEKDRPKANEIMAQTDFPTTTL